MVQLRQTFSSHFTQIWQPWITNDEARSLSQHQQQQKQKILRKCKPAANDPSSFSSSTTSYNGQTSNGSGKWKREKKYLHKTSTASACDSTSSDLKSASKFLSNVNHKCSSSSNSSDGGASENEAEPLDMSKRTVTKERGEPPSYFQSILCSNYSRRQSGTSAAVFPSSMDKNSSSTMTNTTLATAMTTTSSTLATAASPTTTSCSSSLSPTASTDDKEAMCDQVINEHFRRSLGRDYLNVFSANKPPPVTTKEHEDDSAVETVQPPAQVHSDQVDQRKADSRCISPSPLSVDDHFAKALGETWIKLQQQQQQQQQQQKKNDDQKQVSCPSVQATISHQVNES